MEFKVKILQNRKSWGLRSVGADDIEQAESGLLAIICDYLNASPAQSRFFYEVRAEGYRKLLFHGYTGKSYVKLKVELRQVSQ